MKSTFKILFFIRKEKANASGKAPIYVRLTIDGQLCQFSTKSDVSMKLWDAKSNRALGRTEEASSVNSYLDFFRKNLLESYQELYRYTDLVTPDAVRDKFLGKEEKTTTLLGMFSDFIAKQEKLIGVDIAQSTFNKFCLTYRRLGEFMAEKMKKKDIPIYSVDHNFVSAFHTYLKVDKKLSINSSDKLMRIFKRVTTFAFKTGQAKCNPFALYTIKKEKTRRGFLTEDEFARFYHFQTSNKRLQRVRDIFVFACLTGMDYSTLSSFSDEHIIRKRIGMFIHISRVKTPEVSHIKLLPQALELLEKFEASQKGPKIIPMISNDKYNEYLQEIAGRLGIEKRVTSHLACHIDTSII